MKTLNKTLVCTALLGASALALAPLANATPVIDLATGNTCGTALPTFEGTPGSYVGIGSSGQFSVTVIADGVGQPGYPPNLLDSTNVDVHSTGSMTPLYVCVTETGLIGTSLQALQSTLNTNSPFPAPSTPSPGHPAVPWTVMETTYASPTDVAFGTSDQLYSDTFSAMGSAGGTSALSLSSPFTYSLTEIYKITATDGGTLSASMDIADVPEPATLALLAVGLLGTAIGLRRRRRS